MYGIYCTKARGPCALGLRAINAMHPECTWTSLYPVGIALKKEEKISSSYLKRTHKLLSESSSEPGYKASLWTLSSERQLNFWASRDRGIWSNPHSSWATATLTMNIVSVTYNIEFRSQELTLELLTIPKTRLYVPTQQAYLGTRVWWLLTTSLWTSNLPLHFPPYAPFSLARQWLTL